MPKAMAKATAARSTTTREVNLGVKLGRKLLRLTEKKNGTTWLTVGPTGPLMSLADVFGQLPDKGACRKLRKALTRAGRPDMAAVRF